MVLIKERAATGRQAKELLSRPTHRVVTDQRGRKGRCWNAVELRGGCDARDRSRKAKGDGNLGTEQRYNSPPTKVQL